MHKIRGVWLVRKFTGMRVKPTFGEAGHSGDTKMTTGWWLVAIMRILFSDLDL